LQRQVSMRASGVPDQDVGVASGEPRSQAGAERTLEGVGSTALFSAGCTKRNRLSILWGAAL
jgi:hypothetical protein